MHDDPIEFDRLDALLAAHPPASGPADFAAAVMQRISTAQPRIPLWEHPAIQWIAASIGLFFTLGRLLGYIFSAWLSIQLAG